MTPAEAEQILQKAEEAIGSTLVEECLGLLTAFQEGSEGQEALTPMQRGTALALETYAKDLLAAEEGFCGRYLQEVLEQIRPGTSFREGLARTLARLGRSREALHLTEDLARRLPGDWRIQGDLAELRLVVRDVQGARDALGRAVDLVPAAASRSLQERIREMDGEDLLSLAPARILAMESGADGTAAFVAGWRELTIHRQPDYAAVFFARAVESGLAMGGLRALQAVAMGLSRQPMHGRRALEEMATGAGTQDTVEQTVIRAVLVQQKGESVTTVVQVLGPGLDQVLLLPTEKRSWTLEWFLESARLLLTAEDDRGVTGEGYQHLVRRALAHGEVGLPVLRAWRHACATPENTETLNAHLYAVRLIVEGVSLRHASDAPVQPALAGEVVLPFAVAYEVAVLAADESEARHVASMRAQELELLLGGAEMVLTPVAIEALHTDAVRRPYGVLRRSGRIFHQGDGMAADGT